MADGPHESREEGLLSENDSWATQEKYFALFMRSFFSLWSCWWGAFKRPFCRWLLGKTRWPQWWLPPFLVTTASVIVLQVGPGPLVNALFAGPGAVPGPPRECRVTGKALTCFIKDRGRLKLDEKKRQSPDSAVPKADAKAGGGDSGAKSPSPVNGSQDLAERKRGGDIEARPQDSSSRPLDEIILLESHSTATQEIRERISQEHVYFALKFSIIGAILVVLFRLTRRTDIDEFLQMRRSALFFSAALLACAIVDTRLRFNSLVIETLGGWLKDQFEPWMRLTAKTKGVSLADFESWEMYFKNAENSVVMATLRYFSMSLTALLHAVFVYLFMVLPTRAHRPTMWLVFWTSVFLTALLLPIGASYCSFGELTGMNERLAAELANRSDCFWMSAFLAGASVLAVGIIFAGKWIHMKHFLDGALRKIVQRCGIRMQHLESKAGDLWTRWQSANDKSAVHPSPAAVEHELRQCRNELSQLETLAEKLLRRWADWRQEMGLEPSILSKEMTAPIVSGLFFQKRKSFKEVEKALDRLVNGKDPANANDSTPREELPDLEEYLWNLYLAERNRRHSVPKRPVGFQTGLSWWDAPP